MAVQISLTKFTLIFTGWLVLFGVALSGAEAGIWAQAASSDASGVLDSRDARARWNSLSPDEKTRLRKRFERLESMNESERAQLVARANKLKRQEERVLKSLSPEHRRRLTTQPPSKRKELLAEMVESERRERGVRIESKLPKKTRDWLRNSPPEERAKRLERFRELTRERISALAVEGLARSLGYGPEEVRRLEQLPIEDRMKTVMFLRRKLDTKERSVGGTLKAFTTEMWSELEALTPEDYFNEVLRLRHEGGLKGYTPFNQEERRGLLDAKARDSDRELIREMRQSLKTRPEEFVDLSGLSQAERKGEIAKRRRQSLVRTIRRFEALAEDEIKALEELSDEEFFLRARTLANEWSGSDHRRKRKSKGEMSDR